MTQKLVLQACVCGARYLLPTLKRRLLIVISLALENCPWDRTLEPEELRVAPCVPHSGPEGPELEGQLHVFLTP